MNFAYKIQVKTAVAKDSTRQGADGLKKKITSHIEVIAKNVDEQAGLI